MPAPEARSAGPARRAAAWRGMAAGGLSVGVSIAAGLWLMPWVVPLRIVEGPYLQSTSGSASTVLWWTMRPARCELLIEVGGTERPIVATSVGRLHRAHVDGLEAGRSYAYRVRGQGRTLAEATLHTNRGADQPVRIVVFGDSGRGSREQYALAEQMRRARPDLLLHTGDLIYSGGQRANYPNRFFGPYAALLAERPFWPCLGNHDVGRAHGAAPYRDVFELPANGPEGLPAEDSYWFDYANLRIAVLDSNLPETELSARVAPWLGQVFGDAGPERWRFVVLHHPPYSVSKHGCDRRVQRTLVPRFEALGIDLVLCGHDHVYSRTVPLIEHRPATGAERGVVYVVSGAGGARLYAARKTEKEAAQRGPGDELALYPVVRDDVHSFSLLEIDEYVLRFQQLGADGATLDDWSLTRRNFAGGPTSGPAP